MNWIPVRQWNRGFGYLVKATMHTKAWPLRFSVKVWRVVAMSSAVTEARGP